MLMETDILEQRCASCGELITSPEDGDRATVRFQWETSKKVYERTIKMCAACIGLFIDYGVDVDSFRISLLAPDHILWDTDDDGASCTCIVCRVGELTPETPPPPEWERFNPRDYDEGA